MDDIVDVGLEVDTRGDITVLLEQWRSGEAEAFEKLVPSVHGHLHQVAAGYLRRERPGHTLQATGLVHELFLRLLQTSAVSYSDRVHFYAFAAKVMRRILVEHARRKKSLKRGDGAERLPLSEDLAWIDAGSEDILDLDLALSELAELDEFKARVLEVRFFLGSNVAETAEILNVSKSTIDRSLRFGITWLHRRLTRNAQD